MKSNRVIVAFLVIVVGLIFAESFAGDLSAKALILRQVGDQWEVEGQMGVLSNETVTFHVELEHWRNQQLMETLIDEDFTSQMFASCAVCTGLTCSGICTTLCDGKPVNGNCKKTERCAGSLNFDCACDHQTSKKGYILIDLELGDELHFKISPPPGFNDLNPDNNQISYAY